ncbi:MAG: DUF6265 family protein [Flavobacteriales bacterium]
MKSVFLLVVACFVSFTYSFGQNLDELKWILGEWEMANGSDLTIEYWKVQNDSTLVGKGISLKDGKVVFEEELSVELRNGQITYVAVLPHKTAQFLLTDSGNQMAVFEDPKNDFPSKILYELVSDNLELTLFGNQNGQEQSMKLSFIKK